MNAYDFLSLRDSRGIGYELGSAKEEGYTILARDGLFDATKVICHLPSVADFQAVHADRYLLRLQTDQVVALIYLLTAAWLWRMLMIQPRDRRVRKSKPIGDHT